MIFLSTVETIFSVSKIVVEPDRSIGTYGNATFYYYVTRNELYTFYITQNPVWVHGAPTYIQNVTLMLNISGIRSAPNFLFLFTGAIVLFAGAMTIPTAVFYRGKNGIHP
jgi:hypothetical protein